MWIVLAILKWIGILLGGILGLLLFFGALIFFVPVRYRVQGSNRDEVTYSFRFSWLLSIITIAKKTNSEKIMLKVFGIPVKCLAGDNKIKDKKNAEKSKLADNAPAADETQREVTGESRTERKSKRVPKKRKFTKKGSKKRTAKKKKSFSFGKVSSIIGLVKDVGNRRVARRLLREVKQLIRYLSPTKVHGTVVLGTGDPCSTGLLFGGISLFPFVYQDGVRITPDFAEKHFEAEGFMKGRIRVIYFLRLLLRLYQDRELKRLWKQISKVKKEAS